jgi:hypothetical protein
MSALKIKGSSGQHPAVQAFRKKFDSIQGSTLTLVEDMNARITKIKDRAIDPRREEPSSDPRREGSEEIPLDVVDLDELEIHSDPFPSDRSKP